jgi:hypothetical protein
MSTTTARSPSSVTAMTSDCPGHGTAAEPAGASAHRFRPPSKGTHPTRARAPGGQRRDRRLRHQRQSGRGAISARTAWHIEAAAGRLLRRGAPRGPSPADGSHSPASAATASPSCSATPASAERGGAPRAPPTSSMTVETGTRARAPRAGHATGNARTPLFPRARSRSSTTCRSSTPPADVLQRLQPTTSSSAPRRGRWRRRSSRT